MTLSTLTLQKLLERIELKIPIEQAAVEIVEVFEFGKLVSFEPLLVGYEEVNCLLVSTTGKYIVKIFSKNKDLKTIIANVTALEKYYSGGIPIPKLYLSHGKSLYKINSSNTYLIVMDYFEGKKFTEVHPTLEDKKNIAVFVAKINSLHFKTFVNYDSWITINLAIEFQKKKQYLNPDNYALIQSIINEFKKIDYSQLTQSIVHFDLHRENAMKNTKGGYCILDLASTDFNYKVFDLATYLALFCTEFTEPLAINIEIYKEVIDAYSTSGTLNSYEREILLLLIKATFASNLLIPEYLQKSGQDENPEQTIYYKFMGEQGLKLLSGVSKL